MFARMKRHPRSFWAGLVVEVERGAALGEVARRHGVTLTTLRWWRSRLRPQASTPPTPTRFLPVVVTAGSRATTTDVPSPIEVVVRGLVVRVALGTDIAYVADLVTALSAC
jgi:transposase-like protein